jgi:putative ABC transport system permease protein
MMHTSLFVAWRALGRNPLQTALTMLGMAIGVAAVMTMIALGSGAQTAIEDQVRAAGMNLIVVKAGNYKVKTEDDFGGVVDHQAAWRDDQRSTQKPQSTLQKLSTTQKLATAEDTEDTGEKPVRVILRVPRVLRGGDVSVANRGRDFSIADAVWDPRRPALFRLVMHPEDDPMEKHDHPTASQRLGDTEAGLGAAATLTTADADAIRQIPGVQYVAEGLHENARVAVGAKRWFTRLHGGDVQLPQIRRAWSFPSGRFFTAREQRSAAQVMVVGNVVARKLFGDSDPVGRDVKLWNQTFRVIGVITTTNVLTAPAVGDDQFDAVYVPFTTLHRLLNLTKLNDITITAASTGDVTRIAKQVTNLLRARHKIAESLPDDFTVVTQARQALAKGGLRPEVARAVVGNVEGLEKVTLEQLAKTLERASRTMTALLASIAAVSLLVGGIGIMNIMLLSVTERTREIGIRRAVGARAHDVLVQFLVEAVLLSLVGGIVGITLGFVAAGSLSQLLRWSTSISPAAVAVSFGSAAAIGMFFGWYPARQAARLHPIESLRYE